MADGPRGSDQRLQRPQTQQHPQSRGRPDRLQTVLALKAVSLTALTFLDETIYDQMAAVLRRTITDSPSLPIKAAAIHCLGACTFFGGAGEDDIIDQMNFLLEIVSSDGHYANAGDDADVVTAALEEWGFLATEVEDLEHESEDAIEAFAEQLESSESSVQIAAGENIALLYEKSYTPLEDGETIDEGVEDDENEFSDEEGSSFLSDDEDNSNNNNNNNSSGGTGSGPRLIKRYNAYHNTPRILNQVDALAHISGRHINKKSKRSLHANFSSILNTIANPRRGWVHEAGSVVEVVTAGGAAAAAEVGACDTLFRGESGGVGVFAGYGEADG
ncbi:hypothetical protein ACJ72_08714 [Emergomyces africanus]|uniref:Interferon-related developmental regulator N-terminal domain-containing protein n=1 Tax=Emergomyces africanus TaxID=1955775 RepID=A0A1B7NJT9_9EURO|nr:hypothetical protein ACJ72_08714 [Emergomyces africanus]